jgi:hypothetical protein
MAVYFRTNSAGWPADSKMPAELPRQEIGRWTADSVRPPTLQELEEYRTRLQPVQAMAQNRGQHGKIGHIYWENDHFCVAKG